MKKRTVEAIAEAIANFSGYRIPENPLYQARNPGGLKAFSPDHQRDEQGNRIFNSVLDGMAALFFDVELKVSGRSKAQLLPTSTLADLAEAYSVNRAVAKQWSGFLRAALSDESITQKTPLSHFIKEF